jgi:hypothetical protein
MEKELQTARINLMVTEDFRKKYKMHCLKNDFSMSDRLRFLMENDIKELEKK